MSSSENMRKYINILNEAQVFDWDKHKKNIMNHATYRINDPNFVGEKNNPFYNLITGGFSVGAAGQSGFGGGFEKIWNEYFGGTSFIHDDGKAWAQISINYNLERESKAAGRTYNYYITVAKDKNNVGNFLKGQPELYLIMKKLSDENKTPITYKTHARLDGFITHNDSLKIYYYDHNLMDDVKKSVNEWLAKADVKTSARTHDHGVDIEGEDNGSYGELLAKIVLKQFFKIVDQYGKKYTPEQYYEWIKTHMDTIISQVKVERT